MAGTKIQTVSFENVRFSPILSDLLDSPTKLVLLLKVLEGLACRRVQGFGFTEKFAQFFGDPFPISFARLALRLVSKGSGFRRA